MKLFQLCTSMFLLILSFALPMQAATPPARVVLDMNTDWAFYRGDLAGGASAGTDVSAWMPVSLPHIMQMEPKHCGGNMIYDGIGWYRRYFRLPDAYRDKRVVVEFEGVMTNCEVYLNGTRVGGHHGGYMGFVVDLTPHLRWDSDNVLAVRVSAEHDKLTPPGKPQERMDFYYYSGIYRDVRMVVTNKVFITHPLQEDIVAGGGQFVTFSDVTKRRANVNVATHVRNMTHRSGDITVATTLYDAKGDKVAHADHHASCAAQGAQTVRQTLCVDNPALWHPNRPYLYHLRTLVRQNGKVVDDISTPVGIRTLSMDAKKGFFINGEHLYLRGANRHQAYPYVGDAASNSMQEREVIALKQGGYNAVRAAHYPQDPAFLEACDRHGLLVVECIPGWQFYNPDSVFIKRLYEVGRKMIRRDRNHPSVFLWETALNESRYPVSLAKEIQELAHAEYPGDQMYTAGDYLGHADMVDYYDVFYKQVKNYPSNGDVMSNFPEDFIAIKPVFTREWGDGAGMKPRVSLMENEEEQLRQCLSRMTQLDGNGYFDWCMLDANPHMAGHFLWSYNDYNRGSEEETMFSGAVDVNRYPKFCYYMLQSMRSPHVSQPGLYDGPMVFIASYNASPDFSSSTTGITVFSNCDEVRLYRNGTLVGTQTRAGRTPLYRHVVEKGGSPLFVFNAGGYEAGTLKAEALIDGKVVAEHSVRTPGAAHHVVVDIKTDGIIPVADGSDMIPVYFKICDKDGTLVHDATHRVSIKVSGEGVLMGDSIRRIGINPQKVEGGVGFAFIRTTRKAGKIKVMATADGLETGKAEVRTKANKRHALKDGNHAPFRGNEEDNVVVKPTTREKQILQKPRIPIATVEVSGYQPGYPASNITDNNDRSWWIAPDNSLPQVITVSLNEPRMVTASRIVFQKDSSTYGHKVEVSEDGTNWTTLYDRECTGWEFKPMPVNRTIRHLRLTIHRVSEGRAGLGEISLY